MKELEEPLRFDTKSTSTARDLFYTYDAVAHFHAAQINKELEPDKSKDIKEEKAHQSGKKELKKLSPLPFIKANALGLAILRGKTKDDLGELLPLLDLDKAQLESYKPSRSIVLVDEIDKAPRDFPNDILNEIEELYFTIPELDNLRVDIAPEYRPVLIMTSNSEKHLPDAFLRRCVYYNIEFPEKRLEQIICNHLDIEEKQVFDDRADLFRDAQTFFLKLREGTGLRKKPGTAELLDWLWVLERTLNKNAPLRDQDETNITNSFSSLVKNDVDQKSVLDQWNDYKKQS
ncbi:AAA family ATPase [Candidatus Venteria ishoeyi]|nr:MoxR family ATPase [Candidatus Venteria ishoeyi]